MNLTMIILAGSILGAAAVVQSAVGFGYALFASPLLVWIGIPIHQVVVMVAVGSLIQSLIGARRLRASIPWSPIWKAMIFRIAGLLAGLFILRMLMGLDARWIRFSVGAALCLLVVIQAVWKPRPSGKSHRLGTIAAFSASGLLAGTVGMGGPPLVLWVMSQDWPPDKIRGFYFAAFLTFIPILIGMMLILPWFGPLGGPLLTGLAFAPAIYCGSRVGLFLGGRLSKPRLLVLTRICLIATGLSAMLFSF